MGKKSKKMISMLEKKFDEEKYDLDEEETKVNEEEDSEK